MSKLIAVKCYGVKCVWEIFPTKTIYEEYDDAMAAAKHKIEERQKDGFYYKNINLEAALNIGDVSIQEYDILKRI